MKKFNAKFLLIQGAIILGISVIAGFLISFFMDPVDIVYAAEILTVMILFVLLLCYGFFGNIITGSIAKKTMEKHSQ
ncbi:hypothetical protein [Roseburia sp. 499]|uniref:hypothetical protein n=1 Tax=Roseburia sp. 499 TaxID=1261634 RepID=UPI0009511C5A|nr:hypothetical protein [Roseburia sp. 499]WVK70580.1 hypothetical protein BIV20_03360 [Roseburia sp. 499]